METQRQCVSCGAHGMTHFENETFRVEYRGEHKDVPALSGWRCGTCGEVEFDPGSGIRHGQAGDDLVLAARKREGEEIRRIRGKLGLTQVEAAQLTGGGHNAFSRYERGEAAPMPAILNLLRLLDRHPELLRELRAS